jgi:hypothetical protein
VPPRISSLRRILSRRIVPYTKILRYRRRAEDEDEDEEGRGDEDVDGEQL